MAGKDDIARLACVWIKSTPEGLSSAIALIDSIEMLLELAETKDSKDLSTTIKAILSACPTFALIWSSEEVFGLCEAFAEIHVPFKHIKDTLPCGFTGSLTDFLQPEFELKGQQSEENTPNAVLMLLNGLMAASALPRRQFALQDLMASPYMTIDLGSVKMLDLYSSRPSSLFQVLNKTNCILGKAMLKRWISQPLRDIRAIQDRQNIVGELIKYQNFSVQLSQMLQLVPDLNKLFLRFSESVPGARQRATLADCVILCNFGKVLQTVDKLMTQFALPSLQMYTTFLKDASLNFKSLVEFVEKAIDQSHYATDLEYSVNPEGSKEFIELRCAFENFKSQAKALEDKVRFDLKLRKAIKLKLVTSAQGYVFKVNKAISEDDLYRLYGYRYRIISQHINHTVFTILPLEKLSEQLMKTKLEMEYLQDGFAVKVIDFMKVYVPSLPKLAKLIGELDVFLSFATVIVSSSAPYIRGNSVPGGDIFLYQNRHPGLEKTSTSCHANNVLMRKCDSYIQIITGSIRSGKSTYLCQVALAVILNQIGCYIPCHHWYNQLPIVSSILSMTNGPSIIASMMSLSSTLNAVEPDSLVLIDEWGENMKSTDTIGVLLAGIEKLALSIKCFVLLTTHFTELIKLELPGIAFSQTEVEMREGRLHSLYSIKDGRASSTYWMDIARVMGFPENSLNVASSVKQHLEEPIEESMYQCIGAALDGDSRALEKLASYI